MLKKKILRLEWMFFDVDGILTDGSLVYEAEGEISKKFNVLDGYGIKSLIYSGISVGLISSRDHPATRARAIELGINNVMLGKEDKLEAFINWSNAAQVNPRNCGHMGDDYPDLELFNAVGFAASVPNAIEKVKEKADYVTKTTGGNGAAREVADLILTFKDNRES
ncbi:HAD hydrolase family protein [Betaproteobacteria bacterium]|nr:HAD hydrolase family protein [Betaproteobacteria bacterium]